MCIRCSCGFGCVCNVRIPLTLANLTSPQQISSERSVYVHASCVCFIIRLYGLFYTRCFLSTRTTATPITAFSIVRRLFLLSVVVLECCVLEWFGRLCMKMRAWNLHGQAIFLPSFQLIFTVRYLVIIMCVHAKWQQQKNAPTFFFFTSYSYRLMCVSIYFASYCDRPINLFLLSFDFIAELKRNLLARVSTEWLRWSLCCSIVTTTIATRLLVWK